MAKQRSPFKLEGTISDITFYKTTDGYLAKEKSSISATRIATAPEFERTRENGVEFGHAGTAAKLLRRSIRTLLNKGKDKRVGSRLTREMMKVVKSDATSTRGQRNVLDGETEMLQGFDFNIKAPLGSTLGAPYNVTINRVAGTTDVSLSPFVPADAIEAPTGATHFNIVSAGVEIDFEAGVSVQQTGESGMMPLDNIAGAAVTMTHTLTANSTHPIFVLLGVQFYQEVNGIKYSLKNGGYNALGLVKVSGL
jgi:hypothetical protein